MWLWWCVWIWWIATCVGIYIYICMDWYYNCVYILHIARISVYIFTHTYIHTYKNIYLVQKRFGYNVDSGCFFLKYVNLPRGHPGFDCTKIPYSGHCHKKQIASNPTALGFQLARRSCQLGNHQNHQIHKFCALKIIKSISMTHDIGLIWFGLIWFRGIATPNRKVQILLKVQKEW
jgi:hypothetical protein